MINNREELIKPMAKSLADVYKIFLDAKFVDHLNQILLDVITVKMLKINIQKFV